MVMAVLTAVRVEMAEVSLVRVVKTGLTSVKDVKAKVAAV